MTDIASSSTALVEGQGSQSDVARSGVEAFARAAALTVRLALTGSSNMSRPFVVGVSDAMTTSPQVEYLVNATRTDQSIQKLASRLERLFRDGEELRFEDGIENELSGQLYRLLMFHSAILIEALAAVIVAEQVNSRVAAEALRHLGRFVHPPTHLDRLWLLGRALTSSSPLERDGAALGLAQLDDPAAIGYIKAAIDAETVGSLKEDLKQILEGLQHTRECRS